MSKFNVGQKVRFGWSAKIEFRILKRYQLKDRDEWLSELELLIDDYAVGKVIGMWREIALEPAQNTASPACGPGSMCGTNVELE